MSEPTALLPPPEPPPPEPPPAAPPSRSLPWLTTIGFVILAAGLLLVWLFPATPESSDEAIDRLARHLATLQERVTRLEQRPSAQALDLGPLTARVTALEQRPASSPPPAELKGLADRVVALEKRPAPAAAQPAPAPDLAPLEARIAALEQRRLPDLAPLAAQVAALEQRKPPDLGPLETKMAALETSERAMEKRMNRTAQVQAAATALAAGQKLGELPGAPAALARFANTAPPTEAVLRLAFPDAAREALAAAHPTTGDKPLLTRLWSQAQELVTVRQGDRVLVGDPTAGVLEQARAALDAGDLAGAVASVASLQAAPAQAMASWLGEARGLLEARAALAAWAAAG